MLSRNADYTHSLRHFARTQTRDSGTLETTRAPLGGCHPILQAVFISAGMLLVPFLFWFA